MDPVTLKENFNTQLKTVNEQIAKLEEDLAKSKEYKLKLQGGLETLELMEAQQESETPSESTEETAE